MRRHALIGLALVFTIVLASCSDVPAPSSKGNRAVGVEQQEIQDAKPPPTVQEGVVPDLVGVTVGGSKKAIADAGFTLGSVEKVGLFGTPTNKWIVCEQTPAAGGSPGEGTEIVLTADRQC